MAEAHQLATRLAKARESWPAAATPMANLYRSCHGSHPQSLWRTSTAAVR